MSEDNLALWRSVERTDPAHTKQFTGKGGFSGTAIGAMYLIRKATEKWGPIGYRWGVTIQHQGLMDGGPILNANLECVGRESVHYVMIELWYPTEDGNRGTVPAFGQTQFVTQRKDGKCYTDEEAPKKSLTDATTKALSWLGFAADVHMGRYDDNKYVNQVRDEFRVAGLREQSLDILRKVATQGREAMRLAWKAMSKEARDSIEGDVDQMEEIKAIADEADEARKTNYAPSGAKPANA